MSSDVEYTVEQMFEAIEFVVDFGPWEAAVNACDDDVDASARLLNEVDLHIASLRAARSLLTSRLARIIPFGEHPVVDGIGALTVRGGQTYKRFDSDRLVAKVKDRVVAKHSPGEVVTVDGEAVNVGEILVDVVGNMLALTGATAPSFNAWRSGVAKQYGITLSVYATESEASQKDVTISRSS